MKLSSTLILPVCLAMLSIQACANSKTTESDSSGLKPSLQKTVAREILTGAAQTEKYLPLLQGKRVGMVVNPTSVIENTTSVDSLLKRDINIVRIFGPEHGFRGNASAGIKVADDIDQKTGIKAISLYGKHQIPSTADLADVDIMVFDIQP